MTAHNNFHPKYRPDIDGFRALAILPVVAYHAFPSYAPGGFIGVDIFFVISGYLISLIIFRSSINNDFSFSEFYAHRIKRIFPALILVASTCYAVGWFALLPDEFKQLGKHIAAGMGFVQNFVLWKEAGYFDVASELKPLMHLWSLAVEEQFYLLFPLLVWAAWKGRLNVLTGVIVLGVISFVLNQKGIGKDAVKTFFAPQTRFWELMAGSVLAYVYGFRVWRQSFTRWIHAGIFNRLFFREIPAEQDRRLLLSSLLSFLGLALIVYSITKYNHTMPYPGIRAVAPVSGAVLLILAGPQAWVNRQVLSRKFVVWVGLISYPLYLWHWPLLAFARIVESETPSRNIRITAVTISFVLAALTYYLVEKRIRYARSTWRMVAVLTVLAVLVGYVGYNAYSRDGLNFRPFAVSQADISRNLKWDGLWDQEKCIEKYNISPCVSNGDDPKIIILGDSHANHIYPGLTQLTSIPVLQAGTCPPLVGVTLHVLKNQNQHPCATNDFLGKNFEIISKSNIRVAIISSFWKPVLNGEIPAPHEKYFWGGLRLVPKLSSEQGLSNSQLVFNGLKRTIDFLIKKNIKVILIRDTPDLPGNLVDYCKLHSPVASKDCIIKKSEVLMGRALEDELVTKLRNEFPGIAIVDPLNLFCDENSCYLKRNGVLYFRDQHHLSISGSREVANELLDKISF